jgi:hypothetical protein
MNKFNINHDVIIYPSDKGWWKIKENLIYAYDVDYAERQIASKRTEDGGFKEQLWCIMQDHSNLFYNGTDCLKSITIDLINE